MIPKPLVHVGLRITKSRTLTLFVAPRKRRKKKKPAPVELVFELPVARA